MAEPPIPKCTCGGYPHFPDCDLYRDLVSENPVHPVHKAMVAREAAAKLASASTPAYQPPAEQVSRAQELLSRASTLELDGADALWRAHHRWLGGVSSAGGAPLPSTLAECRPVPAAAHLVMFREALSLLGDLIDDPGYRLALGLPEQKIGHLFWFTGEPYPRTAEDVRHRLPHPPGR